MLVDISVFSISLQQIINEWILRQIFLRITETGKTECKNHFLVSVTEAGFQIYRYLIGCKKYYRKQRSMPLENQ